MNEVSVCELCERVFGRWSGWKKVCCEAKIFFIVGWWMEGRVTHFESCHLLPYLPSSCGLGLVEIQLSKGVGVVRDSG